MSARNLHNPFVTRRAILIRLGPDIGVCASRCRKSEVLQKADGLHPGAADLAVVGARKPSTSLTSVKEWPKDGKFARFRCYQNWYGWIWDDTIWCVPKQQTVDGTCPKNRLAVEKSTSKSANRPLPLALVEIGNVFVAG